MDSTAPRRNPLEELAEEFLQRYRAGERPPLTEYAERCPELADEIRELFPALVMMEQARPLPWAGGDGGRLDRLGDYRILREVGRGGMGIVYEAEQESLGRHVALKVLSNQMANNAIALERFRREARSAARLHHTNIVPVFEVGECHGTHYYTMQFILGQSLDEVLAELKRLRAVQVTTPASRGAAGVVMKKPLTISLAHGLLTGHFTAAAPATGPADASHPECGTPPFEQLVTPIAAQHDPHATPSAPAIEPTQATSSSGDLKNSSALSERGDAHFYRSVAHLGLQVAEALAYAHAQRVLHRDIKPSNLLLDTEGTVWVTDFGLAKADDSAALTHSGDIVGTVRYMAPERFEGKADVRSDVYALGVTLYELLALEPAFGDTDRARLIGQISAQTSRPLRELAPSLPRDLDTVVQKAMAREPEARYATAAAVADDLRLFLENRPIKARRASTLERTWRWCRRRPAAAALIATSCLLIISVAVISSVAAVLLGQANKGKDEQLYLKEQVQQQNQRLLYDSLLAQAQALHWSGRPGRRLGALAALKRAAALARQLNLGDAELVKLRTEAITAMTAADLTIEESWPGYPEGTIRVAFNKTHDLYARMDQSGRISVRRRVTDRELRRLQGLAPQPIDVRVYLRISPHGRFLTAWYRFRAEGSRALLIWDLQQNRPGPTHRIPDVCGFNEFAPAEPMLAYGCADKSTKSIVLFDLPGAKEVRRLAVDTVPFTLAFHPSRPLLAVGGFTAPYAQICDLVQGRVRRTLAHQRPVDAVAWSADGKILATGCEDHKIYLWDGDTGHARGYLAGHSWEIYQLSFSHRGDVLISTAFDGTTRLWDLRTRQTIITDSETQHVHFSPDDRWAGYKVSKPQIGLLRFTRCREYSVIEDRPPRWGVRFSADGRLLLSTGSSGPTVWDLNGRAKVLQQTLDTAAHDALFEPDGKHLLVLRGRQLQRWPLSGGAVAENTHAKPRLPVPETLLELPERGRVGAGMVWADAEHKVLRLYSFPGGLILFDIERRQQKAPFLPFPRQYLTAISPSLDSRWLAVGASEVAGYRVWNAQTGEVVLDRPGGAEQFVQFSPDSAFLVVGHGGAQTAPYVELIRTGSWRVQASMGCVGHSSAPRVAFAPDGSFLAITKSGSDIALVKPTTLEPIAELRNPEPFFLTGLAFRQDGSQLATATINGKIQLWDLGLIRHRLAEMGLDWQSPSREAVPAR